MIAPTGRTPLNLLVMFYLSGSIRVKLSADTPRWQVHTEDATTTIEAAAVAVSMMLYEFVNFMHRTVSQPCSLLIYC